MNEIPEQLAVTATPGNRSQAEDADRLVGFRKQQGNYFRAQGTEVKYYHSA